MRAVVVERPGSFRVHEVADPRPGPGEVLVHVRCCGVCGTDVHIAHGEFPPAPYPLIPGHEFCGDVLQLGAGVDTLAPGIRVGVDPTLPCGQCGFCQEGHPNLCERWGAIGDTASGAFAELVAVPARNCYPLPANLTDAQGALIEPLACVLWAMRRVRPEVGDTAIVFGAGTMGLLLLSVLRHAGVGEAAIVDINPRRLEIARGLGARHTVAAGPKAVAALADLYPRGAHIVADATGRSDVVQSMPALARRGGTILIFGVTPATERVQVSPFEIYNKDLTIVGSMAINQTYAAAVRLAPSLDLAPILAEPLPLEAYPDVIAHFGQGDRIKVQLSPTA